MAPPDQIVNFSELENQGLKFPLKIATQAAFWCLEGTPWVKVEASLNLFPKVQKGRNLYYINQSMWLINK